MKLQDYMVTETQKAADEAFKYAKAVPDDKLAWSATETGRTVLSLCREMAQCGGWAYDIISKEELPQWNEESMAAIQKEAEQWSTVEECQAECNNRLAKLFDLIKSLPDEKLADTKWLPYDGGRDFTVAEMMDYPRWNFNYHLGQIAYIQTLYGDKDMH